nr:hypothetical protein [candidate division Zixibacteria bacterium]
MNYSNLVNRAFILSWKHKILWILGFFAASFGTFSGLDDIIEYWSDKHSMDTDNYFFENIIDWFQNNPEISVALILFIVGAALLLGLILFVLGQISIAGLIEGVIRIEGGREYKLRQLFKVGASFFWRYIGLLFIFIGIGIVFGIVLIAPIVIAFVIAKVLGVLGILIGIPILFAGIFFFGNIYSLAQREIISNQTPVTRAIGEGYHLVVKNLGPNIVIFLIEMFLSIAIVIAGLIIIAMFAIPMYLLAAVSTLWLVLILLLGIPIFLWVIIVVEGFLGTFFNSLMTLFYIELRKITPPRPGPQIYPGPTPEGTPAG